MWIAHAPGMPGTFSPPPRVSDPDMHRGTSLTHGPWCMSGSLTSDFLRSRWRVRRSRHSRRMRNPQFYVSGKWPMQIQTRILREKSASSSPRFALEAYFEYSIKASEVRCACLPGSQAVKYNHGGNDCRFWCAHCLKFMVAIRAYSIYC